MLKTIDLVKVADTTEAGKKNGLTKYHGIFTRPYLSRGTGDNLVTEVQEIKTSDNGVVKVDVSFPETRKDAEGKRLAVQTVHDPAELLRDAIDYYSATPEAKDVNPVLLLLQDADDGLVSRLRMKRRNELIPSFIDEDKALLKQATVMHNTNPKKFPTVESAIEAIKALYA